MVELGDRMNNIDIYEKVYDFITDGLKKNGKEGLVTKDAFVMKANHNSGIIDLEKLFEYKGSNTDFLHVAYVEILGRFIDESGFDGWNDISKRFNENDFRAMVIYTLISSEESKGFKDKRIIIKGNRSIDNNVIEFLKVKEDINVVDVDYFMNMEDVENAFIKELYINSLDRPIDTNSYKLWLKEKSQLSDIKYRKTALISIAMSREARQRKKTIINNHYNIKKITIIDDILNKILSFGYNKVYLSLPEKVQLAIKKLLL